MVVAKYSCAEEFKDKSVMFMGISPGLVNTMLPNENISTLDPSSQPSYNSECSDQPKRT